MGNENYGKYDVPLILLKLIQYQEQFRKEGLSEYGDLLGNYFSIDDTDSRYLNTPLDCISFAHPGSDGIHYGFLTDFGSIDYLESAYIVRVSPMDFDQPVKIVARNIYDFLRLLIYYPLAPELTDMDMDYAEFKSLVEDEPELLERKEHDEVRKTLVEAFQVSPIESLYDYLQQLKCNREKDIVLTTKDGIGVAGYPKSEDQLFNWDGVEDLELQTIQNFFENSSILAKLAFIREAQSLGLIFDNLEVKSYIKLQFRLLGMKDEAVKVSYP